MSISIIDYSYQQLLLKICQYGFLPPPKFRFRFDSFDGFCCTSFVSIISSTSVPYFHQLKILFLLHVWCFFSMLYRSFFETKIITLFCQFLPLQQHKNFSCQFLLLQQQQTFQKLKTPNFKHYAVLSKFVCNVVGSRMHCND